MSIVHELLMASVFVLLNVCLSGSHFHSIQRHFCTPKSAAQLCVFVNFSKSLGKSGVSLVRDVAAFKPRATNSAEMMRGMKNSQVYLIRR